VERIHRRSNYLNSGSDFGGNAYSNICYLRYLRKPKVFLMKTQFADARIQNLKIILIKTLYKLLFSVSEVGARDAKNFVLPVNIVQVM
jgi:hypothetical protein